MANYREEQLRSNRRLARQIIGGAAIILALIGLFTVLGWLVAALRGLVNDAGRKENYADRLYGMVMLDAAVFEKVEDVDPAVFKQAAIWGTVYQVQKSGESLDIYDRDPETGSAMIPRLEVDTYISNLLGPNYTVPEGAFSTDQFSYQYDEASQSYLVPVTSGVAQFTPVVESIETRSGRTYVTVGYVPTANNSAAGESLTAATEPTKYMDYVFERGENRQWYLSALEISEKQATATPTPAPTAVAEDAQALVEGQLAGGTDSEISAEDAASDAAAAEETPAEDAPAEEAPAEGEEAASDSTESDSAESDSAESDSAESDSTADS